MKFCYHDLPQRRSIAVQKLRKPIVSSADFRISAMPSHINATAIRITATAGRREMEH
jgi:hypothetical protein